jgi:hypothetical protein
MNIIKQLMKKSPVAQLIKTSRGENREAIGLLCFVPLKINVSSATLSSFSYSRSEELSEETLEYSADAGWGIFALVEVLSHKQ